jgi:hypothetical protein
MWKLALILLASCSSEFSLASESGCNTVLSNPPDDCGPTLTWRTVCTLPLGKPWNSTDCHSPGNKELSTVWCCTNAKPDGG